MAMIGRISASGPRRARRAEEGASSSVASRGGYRASADPTRLMPILALAGDLGERIGLTAKSGPAGRRRRAGARSGRRSSAAWALPKCCKKRTESARVPVLWSKRPQAI